MLVDSRPASASELLARTVQVYKRGTVLGDRTAGAVMRSRARGLTASHGEYIMAFGFNVTVADVLMSDGGRLERLGVVPDRTILPSPADLAAGRDPVLAEALTMLGHPTDAIEAAKIFAERH